MTVAAAIYHMNSFVDTNLADRHLLSHDWMMTLFSRRPQVAKRATSTVTVSPSKQPLIPRTNNDAGDSNLVTTIPLTRERMSRKRSDLLGNRNRKLSPSAYKAFQSPVKKSRGKPDDGPDERPEPREISFVSADKLQDDPLRGVPPIIWAQKDEVDYDAMSEISFENNSDENEDPTLPVMTQADLLMGDSLDKELLMLSSSSCSSESTNRIGQMITVLDEEPWGVISKPLSGEWPSDEDKSPLKKGAVTVTDLEARCSLTWSTNCDQEVEAVRIEDGF